jgi:aryl-alcohol dehydrogenase-like predicted oxidoreductase
MSILGRSGVRSSALGLGSSFGLSADDLHYAYDRGVRYYYWGSLRRPGFGKGVRELARQHRDQMVTVIQSYSRSAMLLGFSLERGLKSLKLDYTDFLLLGWWDQPPPRRILDAALALRDKGRCKHIMISCHARSTFARYIADPAYGAIMVRYNAAHTGAEQEVFPKLDEAGDDKPGVISYTATRWGVLLDPKLTPPGERTPRATDCYRFALSDRHVDVVLSGPANRAELDEALLALDRGPLDAEGVAWMRRVGQAVRAAAPLKSTRTPLQTLDKWSAVITGDRGD